MPIQAYYPPIDVPNISIWDLLFERKGREFPDDKVIYIDSETNRSYTFAQVRRTAIRFGQGLQANWQWQKNDVLAIYAPNCIDTPSITWGCHWAGGVVSPANPAYTAKELAFQLKDAGAKGLVTHVSVLEVARGAAKMVGLDEKMIILMGDDRDSTFKHFIEISVPKARPQRRAKISPKSDLAYLVYSSGTTGLPKGVMLSHENIVSNVMQLRVSESPVLRWDGDEGNKGRGDSVIGFLPFFHIYGLTVLVHASIYRGLTLVTMARFDLERFCQLVQDHKITFGYLVPPVVLLLAKHPVVEKYDLSSLRMVNTGAAPQTPELTNAFYARLKVPCKQAYGLSETSPSAIMQRWEDWQKYNGSVGVLNPNMTAKIVAPDGKEVPTGQMGELLMKGPNIFKGYLNNPEGTANAFDEEGYFKSGDVGYVEEKGNFYITDRLKELIKYKGFQVAPAELEGSLLDHPEIDDVAVIGVYDADQATEVPRAYVVLKQGANQGESKETEISKWLETRVANHKRLRGGVRFVNEVPKSASGKILRRMLTAKVREEEEAKKAIKPKL